MSKMTPRNWGIIIEIVKKTDNIGIIDKGAKKESNLYKFIVYAVGEKVKDLKVGDEVFAFTGGCFEFEFEEKSYLYCEDSFVKWKIE